MPQYDGTVDEFKAEAENFSDEELEGFAADDDRDGVVKAAEAELASRAAGDDGGETLTGDEAEEAARQEGLAAKLQTTLINPDNAHAVNLDPDAGQNEVQAKFDEAEITGFFPPTGGPPSPDSTVAGVTGNLDEDAGSREAADEAFERLHGRAPGDPVV